MIISGIQSYKAQNVSYIHNKFCKYQLNLNLNYVEDQLICLLISIILECDPTIVSQRAAFRTDDIPIGEQTVASVSKFRYLVIPYIFANYLINML